MTSLGKLRRLTWRQRLLTVEAALSLVSSLLQVRLLPFGRVASWHGWTPAGEPLTLTEDQLAVALEVKRFVGAVSRRTPWTSTCLMQSLTAATLLRRRGITSVTFLGMAPIPEGYDAHSWTVAGDRFITGGPGHQRFTVVASYRTQVAMRTFEADVLPPGLRDVEVGVGEVHVPDSAEHAGVLWRAEAGRFWLHVPDVADYLVDDGAGVTVQQAPGSAPGEIIRHLLAAPQAVTWMMRGVTVLDASVAVGPEGAVLVAGHAGAGKSTLVAELLSRGWALVADGVAPLVVTDGVPQCLPAARSLSCWGRPDDVRRDWLPGPVPLAAMVLLSETQGDLRMSDPRTGLNRFVVLHQTRYMGTMTRAVLGNDVFLRTAGEIARSAVPLVDIARPAGRDTAAELADLVLGLLGAPRP